jgi:hypothetical protein
MHQKCAKNSPNDFKNSTALRYYLENCCSVECNETAPIIHQGCTKIAAPATSFGGYRLITEEDSTFLFRYSENAAEGIIIDNKIL